MTIDAFKRLSTIIADIQKDVVLAPYTTVKIGGLADAFVTARTPEALQKAVQAAITQNVHFVVIGGGSNILFSDGGVRGLVIRAMSESASFQGREVIVDAGCGLGRLAFLCAQRGLSGLESAIGIPGTIGGAIRGNAGAFGWEMKDSVVRIDVVELSGAVVQKPKEDLSFSYRTSSIAKRGEIILSAVLRMAEGSSREIQEKMKKNLAYRHDRQPLDRPSFGSAFRNVPLSDVAQRVQEEYDMEAHAVNGFVPAGYLIDRCGLKGFRVGDAEISLRHANFLLNGGKATAEQMVMLIGIIKQKVRKKFHGLELQEEFHYVGF